MNRELHSPRIRTDHCRGGYNHPTAEISRLLKEAAQLWIEYYGDENYFAGRESTLVPFLGAAQVEFFPLHKKRFPENWRENDLCGWNRNNFAGTRSAQQIVGPDYPDDGIPVLYFHHDPSGEVIYVGRSMHFMNRQKDHKKNARWWANVETITWKVMNSFEELHLAELEAIHSLLPKYNVKGNGARWYPV